MDFPNLILYVSYLFHKSSAQTQKAVEGTLLLHSFLNKNFTNWLIQTDIHILL